MSDSAPSPSPLDRLHALQAIRTDSERATDPKKQAEFDEARAKAVELDGRAQFFQLRGRWSWWIIIWISVLIIFNIGLTIAVGARGLNFDNLQWFITAVLVETFLQIVGLGYVAVKYLFSDRS